MTWEYWINLFTRTHCTARGLRPATIAAYEATLQQFREFIRLRHNDAAPFQVSAVEVLDYLNYLRQERLNGDAAVQRQLTILKSFYAAMVAMGHLEPRANPLAHMPKMKSKPRKLPVVLTEEEIQRMLDIPPSDIVLGLRDRAILALLYGTGIRASECATLTEGNVDLGGKNIRVTGKGGHQRAIALNDKVAESLAVYRQARGTVPSDFAFFRSRRGRGMKRGAIYERVRKYSRRAAIAKNVSPHTLRHTCATHLLMSGKCNLVQIRDLLGHRCISSTQIYMHITAEDLRRAAACHPIGRLAPTVKSLLGNVKLPLQYAPRRSVASLCDTG
jgi:integrase/recombinase XerD